MIVLVDQDGVLAHFNFHFLARWKANYPDAPFVAVEDRKSFYVDEDYPAEYKDDTRKLIHCEGFFLEMPPIEGALKGMRDLVEAGHEVHICTSPMTGHVYCVPEKLQWIRRWLGTDFERNTIIIQDKTMVRADILIDDKPEIEIDPLRPPVWTQIVFDASYNRHLPTILRMDWGNWRDAFDRYAQMQKLVERARPM